LLRVIAIDVGTWLALWSGVWGLFYALLSMGINYISRPLVTACYFLLATVFVLGFYRDVFRKRKDELKSIPSPVLGLSLGIGVLAYLIFPMLLRRPDALIVQNPAMFFLHFDLRYLFAKVFDIMFQQTLIFMFVRLLLGRGLSRGRTCLLCVVLFGLAHTYLLSYKGFGLGMYFVIFSMGAGWIFPLLIAKYRNGVAYTFSIHWMFYIITGTICWLCPSVFAH
jgi:hypothetical protein